MNSQLIPGSRNVFTYFEKDVKCNKTLRGRLVLIGPTGRTAILFSFVPRTKHLLYETNSGKNLPVV